MRSRSSFPFIFAAALACGEAEVPSPPDEEPQPYDTTPPLIEPSPPANATVCARTPDASSSGGGKTYYRYNNNTTAYTWNQAKSDCEAMGGKLAVPLNATENSALQAAGNGGSRPMFIGFYQSNNQANTSAGWKIVDGAPATYFNWNTGEPNDVPTAGEQNEQNCMAMIRSSGRWDDIGCNTSGAGGPAAPYHYVCQFSGTPAPCPDCAADAAYGDADICTAWVYNESEYSQFIVNSLVGVNSVAVSGTYMEIQTAGIPDYTRTLTQAEINTLNTDHAGMFSTANGLSSAQAGTAITFGQNIGYRTTSCGYGFWPPGPACPSNAGFVGRIPLSPAENAGSLCRVGGGAIGVWVSGVLIFGWGDAQTWNNGPAWYRLAARFEDISMDICGGHAQMDGNYHHHGSSICLRELLGDTGTGHSPIYGFAADGYPVYGPWHANNTLAVPCWKTRDYDSANSNTGCGGGGVRSCFLVNPTNPGAGTIAAPATGPSTSTTYTFGPNDTRALTSGYFFEDYYFDTSCEAQGGQYLDENNGHSHGDYGYHYHVTMESDGAGGYVDRFPNHIGPAYHGTLIAQPSGNGFTGCQ